MKELKGFKIFSYKYVKYSLLLTGGILIGWLFFHSSQKSDIKSIQPAETVISTIWTCAMHPQIQMPQPGKCPICGMELIPLKQSNIKADAGFIRLSKEAAALANVTTSVVSKQRAFKEIRLYGKVQYDERLFQSQVAYVAGRIEKLYVNFTGEVVRKGQAVALIYSPDLVTAQQELIEAAKIKQQQPEIYEAAKEKLRQWKITDNQIESVEKSGSVTENFEIVATTSGILTNRSVNNGQYISRGTILFTVSELSTVWILFDAYESDLQYLATGNRLTFSLQAIPGRNFSGNISFIDPAIDPITRVAKVRIEMPNQNGLLKPEMFATGIVSTTLNKFTDNIVIPKSAVLWTGKRSIVYVKEPYTDEPIFKIREIGLGPMLGESYVVTDGLSEGEEIVTNGTFSVDAAAQLEGKPSMMNSKEN